MKLRQYLTESDKLMRNVKKGLGKIKHEIKVLRIRGDEYAVVQLLWPDTARNAYFALKDDFDVRTIDGTTIQVRAK